MTDASLLAPLAARAALTRLAVRHARPRFVAAFSPAALALALAFGLSLVFVPAFVAPGFSQPLTAEDRPPGPSSNGAEGHFLSVLHDVPLMPGLQEVAGAGLDFETPSGRLVKTEAVALPNTGVEAESVRAFYRETLGALGWERIGPDRYRRDGETLALDIARARDGLSVGFTLTPGR